MNRVYIGIGSNIGDRELYIKNALSSLRTVLKNILCSGYYKTEPRDYMEQDFFLNVVVCGDTDLTPIELLKRTQLIEIEEGRRRDEKIPKGPRTIDLDILLYGNKIIKENILKIPHVSIKERSFVLIPLLELDSDLNDPYTGIKYSLFLEKIEKQGVYCSSLKDYNFLFS